MRACKCPNCGANLNFDETPNNYVFCQYCGTKIDLLDQRTMHTEHIIDDAKIKESEAKMKNAESMSRIVNIFAAPVEEKQRQAEFERQRQLEAERREYKRRERKEAERRADREAMADGCAAVIGKLLVKCVKHPIIALLILCALFGSIKPATNHSSSATQKQTTSSNSTYEWQSDSYLAQNTYHYDVAYTRLSEDGKSTRYYYLISYTDCVVAFVTSKSGDASIGSFRDGDLSTGITYTWHIPAADNLYTNVSRTLKYSDPNSTAEILSIEDTGESFAFVKTTVDAAEKALYQSNKIYDYSS